MSMPTPGRARPVLNRRQKAAIVVRLLKAEGVNVSLAELPDEMQVALTREMSALRYIDRDTLRQVVAEFVAELDAVGLAFPPDVAGALQVLDGTISDATAARLRQEAGLGFIKDPWERISAQDTEKFIPVIEEEAVETAAVILSKLRVSKAAEILGLLPGPKARRIAYAMSQTGKVSPRVVSRIGEALAARFDTEPPSAFDEGPVERVGAILNFSPAATRDEVLAGLSSDDKDFANEVRKAIFTFADIANRVQPRDIPKIVRDIDEGVLINALAAASARTDTAPVTDFVLANMSQRLAGTLRDEMEARGSVPETEGEAAMSTIVSMIREMESAGEVMLKFDDPED